MGLESTSIVIDGRNVNITQMPATHSFRYKVRLVKLLGGSIGDLLSIENGKIKPAIQDEKHLSVAFKSLCEKLDPDEMLKLIIDGFRYTHVDGKHAGSQDQFDSIFSNLAFMYKVYFETLKFNYKSFFELGGIGNREMEPGSGE